MHSKGCFRNKPVEHSVVQTGSLTRARVTWSCTGRASHYVVSGPCRTSHCATPMAQAQAYRPILGRTSQFGKVHSDGLRPLWPIGGCRCAARRPCFPAAAIHERRYSCETPSPRVAAYYLQRRIGEAGEEGRERARCRGGPVEELMTMEAWLCGGAKEEVSGDRRGGRAEKGTAGWRCKWEREK